MLSSHHRRMAKDRYPEPASASTEDLSTPVESAVDEPTPEPMPAGVGPVYIGDEPLNVPVNGAFVRVVKGDSAPMPPGDWPGLNPSTWKA